MHRYGVFTPARRSALRKAQLASAAKRRGTGHGRLRTVAKRTAIGAGVVGAVVGTGVVAHKASGGHYSKTTFQTVPGLPKQHYRTGIKARHYGGSQGTIHLIRGGKNDTHTIRTYSTVKSNTVHGKKASQPFNPKPYKPNSRDIARMKRYNKPHTEDAYSRAAMGVQHSNPHYTSRKISEAEVQRRVNSYQKATRKKVTYAHHQAARTFYKNQVSYTGGTVAIRPGRNKRARRQFRKERRIRRRGY